MDQMVIKYTKIFYCKTLQNLPKIWDFCFENNPSGNPDPQPGQPLKIEKGPWAGWAPSGSVSPRSDLAFEIVDLSLQVASPFQGCQMVHFRTKIPILD
jgi:hypothetical protein